MKWGVITHSWLRGSNLGMTNSKIINTLGIGVDKWKIFLKNNEKDEGKIGKEKCKTTSNSISSMDYF